MCACWDYCFWNFLALTLIFWRTILFTTSLDSLHWWLASFDSLLGSAAGTFRAILPSSNYCTYTAALATRVRIGSTGCSSEQTKELSGRTCVVHSQRFNENVIPATPTRRVYIASRLHSERTTSLIILSMQTSFTLMTNLLHTLLTNRPITQPSGEARRSVRISMPVALTLLDWRVFGPTWRCRP